MMVVGRKGVHPSASSSAVRASAVLLRYQPLTSTACADELYNSMAATSGREAAARIAAQGLSRVAVVGKFCQRNHSHELKAGEMVFPCGRRFADQAPDEPAKEVRKHCQKLGLDVQR